jgi:hypothetical protein
VILETSGNYDIKPKGTNGQDKNIIPNKSVPIPPSLGTVNDRWGVANVQSVDASGNVSAGGNVSADGNVVVGTDLGVVGRATINTAMAANGPVFQVNGDRSSLDAQVLMGASSTDHRVFLATSAMSSTDSDARTILAQENDEADIAVASFKQRNESAPFIDFEGDVAADASKNISSGNGNGSVVGPKAKNTAAMGWTFDKMVKQRITPPAPAEPYDIWVPGFLPDE